MQYANVEWPHFQQFLHHRTSWFIFVPLIVVIYHFIFKHLLMSNFAFVLFWESQISTQTTAIFNLREALIIQGWDARIIYIYIYNTIATKLLQAHVILSLKEKAFRLYSKKNINWKSISFSRFQPLLNLLQL